MVERQSMSCESAFPNVEGISTYSLFAFSGVSKSSQTFSLEALPESVTLNKQKPRDVSYSTSIFGEKERGKRKEKG